jgi:hypothetical protein
MKRKCIGCVFFAAAFIDLLLFRFFSLSITGIIWSPFIFFSFGTIFIYNSINKDKKLVKQSREKNTDVRR